MNKKGAVVYPLDSEFLPVLRHQHQISGYVISHLVSPKGWGYVGEDAGNIDGGNPIGLNVESDFNKALSDCSAVVFVDTNTEVSFVNSIYPKMIEAAKKSKDIICMRYLEGNVKKEIEEQCKKHNSLFKYCFNNEALDQDHNIASEAIFDINTPVIFIMGLSERTNKFSVQMALRENFINRNYVVSQIGSRPYCELLGFHSFPSFMYSNFLHEHEKIVLFNHYVKNIEMQERPDVILIGIPGAMMPMNKQFTEKFGIFAYEVSQAITPDVAILSSFYDLSTVDFFSLVSQTSKYRFGYEIDCFNLTNTAFDWRCLHNIFFEGASYLTLDYNMVSSIGKEIQSPKAPVYSVIDANGALEMTDFIVSKLNGYADTEAV